MGNNFPKQYTLNTFSDCFMHQNFKYFLQNKIWWSELPNCSLVFDEKAALMKFIGKHLCRSFFFNTFLHQQAKKDSYTGVFLWFFFSKHLWVTASPKYNFLFPSTLVILKFFEANSVNCLRAALCGGSRQNVWLSWFNAKRETGLSKMLLETRSSRPAVFCKNKIL